MQVQRDLGDERGSPGGGRDRESRRPVYDIARGAVESTSWSARLGKSVRLEDAGRRVRQIRFAFWLGWATRVGIARSA